MDPILQYPRWDQPFELSSDASSIGIGGLLYQGPEGSELPIAYYSHSLNAAESCYAAVELETLALWFCVQSFRSYLYGRGFILFRDHRPIV